MEFTDAEIREELARLGYKNVPHDKLQDFKKDLLNLIQSERSKTNSLNSSVEERHQEEPDDQSGDLINKNKQWRQPGYHEDWHYKGRDKARPATADPSLGHRDYSSKSFGLFEQPLDIGLQEKNNSSCCMDEYYYCYPSTSSSHEDGRKHMKRKTARPTSSGHQCMEDLASENDAAGVYELYERVRNLAMRDCECSEGRAKSPDSEPPYRIHGPNKNPSVIRTCEPPHTRNLVKTLPWKRHQMYQRLWKVQPVIGEDNRNRIRNAMHAKMLIKEEVKLPNKVFKPNKYVPPTDNPRYQLRWDVRRATSQFEMPQSYYQFQQHEQYQPPDVCYQRTSYGGF